jgi:rod shape-determining protein MreD
MHWLRFAILLFVAALIQGSLLPGLIALKNGAQPDLLVIFLAFFALHCYGYEAVITSFAIGLAADVINQPIGPHIVSFGLIGAVVGGLRNYIAVKRTFHIIATVAAVGIAAELLARLLELLTGQEWHSNTFSLLVGGAVYSGLLAPYFFSGLLMIIDWLGVKKYQFTR